MDPTNKEGIRPFDAMLRTLDDGSVHDELSTTLHKLVGELYELALNGGGKVVKGELDLRLKIAVSPNGSAALAAEIKHKTPKPTRVPSLLFLTKGGNLSTENQKQQKLNLREVPATKEGPREAPAAAPEVRSV